MDFLRLKKSTPKFHFSYHSCLSSPHKPNEQANKTPQNKKADSEDRDQAEILTSFCQPPQLVTMEEAFRLFSFSFFICCYSDLDSLPTCALRYTIWFQSVIFGKCNIFHLMKGFA